MRLCLRRRSGCRPKLGPLHTALLCLFRGCHIRLQLQMMSKVSAWKMQLKVPSWCVLSLVSIGIRLARTHIFSNIFEFCPIIGAKIGCFLQICPLKLGWRTLKFPQKKVIWIREMIAWEGRILLDQNTIENALSCISQVADVFTDCSVFAPNIVAATVFCSTVTFSILMLRVAIIMILTFTSFRAWIDIITIEIRRTLT